MRSARVPAAFCLLSALLCVMLAANLCVGSVSVPLGELARILAAGEATSTLGQVVWTIRLPRLLAAALLGGALALAGLLLQTFFNNPIAGPYILGISSGAKLAVALAMVAVAARAGVMASWMSVAAATAGSLAVMALVLALSHRVSTASTLIVAGVMVGYVCNAATDFVVTFASDASIVNLRNWSMGSFSGTNWDDVRTMALVVGVASACVFLLAKPLGAYQLGEEYARSVGVNVGRFRACVIALSSALAACVTAFAGPISFVGIAVPHLVKRLLKTSRPLVVVPASFLGGAVFCLLSDLVARTALAPTEMSVSTVTAALGAPVVMWVLLGKNRRGSLAATAPIDDAGDKITGPEASPPQAEAPAAGTCVLRAQDLSVGYEGRPVVQGASLELGCGQVLCLLGPNGAGKSTLLKALSGDLPLLGGTLSLCGHDLRGLSSRECARLRATLLTERPHTELLTCADVVGMGRYPYTGRMGVLSATDWAEVRASMELMDVWQFAEEDFMRLSDGQRQRVLVARALCQRPQVLLLDEPTSYLDIRYQVDLLRTLRQLAADRGMGIVMTLHDLPLARQAADWLVCVKDGTVCCQGTPADVFYPGVVDKLFDLDPKTLDPRTGMLVIEPREEGGREEA